MLLYVSLAVPLLNVNHLICPGWVRDTVPEQESVQVTGNFSAVVRFNLSKFECITMIGIKHDSNM